MGKKDEDTNLFGFAIILGLGIVFLLGIMNHNLETDVAYSKMTDEARDDLFLQERVERQQASNETKEFGQFLWEIMNIPIPFILVIILLIAIVPKSAKTWKGR